MTTRRGGVYNPWERAHQLRVDVIIADLLRKYWSGDDNDADKLDDLPAPHMLNPDALNDALESGAPCPLPLSNDAHSSRSDDTVADADADTMTATINHGNGKRSKSARSNAMRRQKRQKVRSEHGYVSKPDVAARLAEAMEPVHAKTCAEKLPTTSTAYRAMYGRADAHDQPVSRDDLEGLGIRVVPYDRKAKAIVGADGVLLGAFLCSPRDDSYDSDVTAAFIRMRSLSARIGATCAPHVRGTHCAVSCGLHMGLGEAKPTILNVHAWSPIVQALSQEAGFKRIAGFQSAGVKYVAPRLYYHFRDSTQRLYQPGLNLSLPAPLFPGSIFPTLCFNMGTAVCCYKHRDVMNVPYGWCAITPLGTFNHTRSALIILWEYGLAFEAPQGCTLYIPSACVTHSNTTIRDPTTEERASVTQYFPGGLLRWLDNGCRTDDELRDSSPEEFERLRGWKQGRWERGLSLLPTWDELKGPASA